MKYTFKTYYIFFSEQACEPENFDCKNHVVCFWCHIFSDELSWPMSCALPVAGALVMHMRLTGLLDHACSLALSRGTVQG